MPSLLSLKMASASLGSSSVAEDTNCRGPLKKLLSGGEVQFCSFLAALPFEFRKEKQLDFLRISSADLLYYSDFFWLTEHCFLIGFMLSVRYQISRWKATHELA